MTERNLGQVVPFRLSAGKMRKSAYEHSRRGRAMEAVELLRRAAQQDDTPTGWLHLAQELRRLGCYEQAAVLLYRILAREDAPILAWMELARCQCALGKNEAAVDSVYHYLAEDPYSDIADDARDMLSGMEEDEAPEEALRLPLLVRRGLDAWKSGRRDAGERRMLRAVHMSRRPNKLYITMALVYMAEGRPQEAIRMLNRVLKRQPDNARAACMLCVAVNAAGHRRLALGLLQQAESLCDTAEGEDLFLTAAWTLSARDASRRYLLARHKQQPYRIMLMHRLADMDWDMGCNERAESWWQRILRLDPSDARAQALIRWGREHPHVQLPPEGMLPPQEAHVMLRRLVEADNAGLSADEMIAPGTESRMAMDWCFTVTSQGIQQKGLEVLACQDTPAIRQYLKELLTSPTVHPDVRNKVILHLADLGETGPLAVLLGQRMTTAECTPVKPGAQSRWRAFLPHLLEETRRHRQSEMIVEVAAEIWPLLSARQQKTAAGMDGFVWVKAMEILYLRMTQQDQAAARVVREMPVSLRKVSRCLRQISRRMEHVPDTGLNDEIQVDQ